MSADFATFIFNMPLDVIMKIVQHLKITDIVNMMLTCKTMKEMIMQDNILWKRIYHDKLIVMSNNEHKA